MKSSLSLTDKEQKEQKQLEQTGRVIAQGMRAEKVQHQKNMAKAEKRHTTMLNKEAERALSGK